MGFVFEDRSPAISSVVPRRSHHPPSRGDKPAAVVDIGRVPAARPPRPGISYSSLVAPGNTTNVAYARQTAMTIHRWPDNAKPTNVAKERQTKPVSANCAALDRLESPTLSHLLRGAPFHLPVGVPPFTSGMTANERAGGAIRVAHSTTGRPGSPFSSRSSIAMADADYDLG